MKLQSNLISYLLLGLIIVGVSVGVYEWGIPILQKSQIRSTIDSIQSQLSSLANAIQNVGENKGSRTLSLSLPSGSINIYNNLIQYSFQSPVLYYNPNIPAIPLNFNIYIPCTVNNTLTVGNQTNLCGIPGLYASANSTNINITDVNNNTLILPLSNANDIITQYFVFNIRVSGGTIQFIPLFNTGIAGSSLYPACLLVASQTNNIINYQIECRPIYNPQTGQCTWIIIKPTGNVGYTSQSGANLNVNLQYGGLNIINNPNSTVCNQLVYIYVDASLT
ncbi:MAG: hypothetical protein ACP5GJ_01240 [Nanopusillaceae archaeon]|jgi:hypothetical protein